MKAGGALTRGSQSTSVDAAFAYRTVAGTRRARPGRVEVHRDLSLRRPRRGQRRKQRGSCATAGAAHSWTAPIDFDGLELADLFHEPIYQLVRQQLLALGAGTRSCGVGQTSVTVVHVLSPDNTAYQQSYIAPALRGRGATASEVWSSLLRSPDRFVSLDPVVFLDPGITSKEYVLRYGGNDA